jgi:inosine-uridine nucleoside N-ribohydrolase
MYDWGDQAQHSAAAYEIIKEAHEVKGNNKLTIIVLGALTNVASALYIDPGIEEKIVVYWLGTTYDFEKGTHKRIEFNAIMDPQATELMLASNVEMHIIPGNVSAKMELEYDETRKRFNQVHPLTDFLVQRWFNHLDGGRYRRTIWDLGLIGAMIHPEWAQEFKTGTFENPNIWVYKDIDAESIIEEFYTTTVDYLKDLPE